MPIQFPGVNTGPFGGPSDADQRMFQQMIQSYFEGKKRQKDRQEQQRQMQEISNMMSAQGNSYMDVDGNVQVSQDKPNMDNFIQTLMANPNISNENKVAAANMAMMDSNRRLTEARTQQIGQPAPEKVQYINLYNTKNGRTRKYQVPESSYNLTIEMLENNLEKHGSDWRVGTPPKDEKEKTLSTIWGYDPKAKRWMPEQYEKNTMGAQREAIKRLQKKGYTKFRNAPPSSKDTEKANEIMIPDRRGGQRKVTEGELRQQYAISHNIPKEYELAMMENSGDQQKVKMAKEFRRKMATDFPKWRSKVLREGLPEGTAETGAPELPEGFVLDQ